MDPHNLFPEMNLRPDPSLDTPRAAKQNQETDKVLRNKYQAIFRSVRNILFLLCTFFQIVLQRILCAQCPKLLVTLNGFDLKF